MVYVKMMNRPFAARHSRGTKPPPCWRANVALGTRQITTTIFNEFHATSYSCLVHTISKNAILGGMHDNSLQLYSQ